MRYIALIYGDESAGAAMSPEEGQAMHTAYATYTEELAKSGVMLGGDALQPTSTATAVAVRDGETILTDGPYAETKEQLAGFYLYECKDLDEAVSWAARIPGAKTGTIEVRPIAVFE